MCFLKSLKARCAIQHENVLDSVDDSKNQEQPQSRNTCMENDFSARELCQKSRYSFLLSNLTNLIRFNSMSIDNLEKNLIKSQIQLERANTTISSMNSPQIQKFDSFQPENHHSHEEIHNDLLSNLFGVKQYRYFLRLVTQFPSLIFKQRNISFSLELVDADGNKMFNSNIIYLCLGVCDAEGNWISENRVGETFMKGKTEIEIYHGEGSFNKIYPRDVSRSYPNGRLNFIIYSKPSVVKFSNQAAAIEQHIESQDIQPLLIKDLTIKAKKKE